MTEEERRLVCLTLDFAHYALRCVDASGPGQPQTAATFHTVSNAIAGIESMARDLGFELSEFRGAIAGEVRTND